MSVVRVADYVADWISSQLELRSIFMVTGAGIMHLTDGVAKHSALSEICLHHEQSVSMAVEAYSRASGKIGVAYVSTGPAATNAVTGAAGAWQDGVACIFISGQVKVSETSSNAEVDGLRQFGVQELNILPIVDSITKYVAQVRDPQRVRYELEKARYSATVGRPGPVWLEIPLDVQSAIVNPEELEGFEQPKQEHVVREPLEPMLESLERSQRPVILVGQGVRQSGRTDELRNFAQRHQIPVVSTYLGTDSYVPHDELFIGRVGVKGERAANIVMQKADWLLALGTSLHVSVIGYNYSEFAPRADKWVFDIDLTSHMKKTVENLNLIEGSIEELFDNHGSLAAWDQRPHPGWNRWARVARALSETYPTTPASYEAESDGVNIYTVVNRLSGRLREGDFVVSDAGSAFYAVSQELRLGESQRYITSGAMATMGYSLPAAFGVAEAVDCRRVFAVTGDGSLHQNIQELGQLAYLRLPVVLVVLDNAGYLSIRASQKNYFDNRFIGTDERSGLGLPDIAAIGRSYGLPVFEVGNLVQLETALDVADAQAGPLVLVVKTPKDQPIVPTVSSKIDSHGKMSSRSLQDMSPLIEGALLEEIMEPSWGFEGD